MSADRDSLDPRPRPPRRRRRLPPSEPAPLGADPPEFAVPPPEFRLGFGPPARAPPGIVTVGLADGGAGRVSPICGRRTTASDPAAASGRPSRARSGSSRSWSDDCWPDESRPSSFGRPDRERLRPPRDPRRLFLRAASPAGRGVSVESDGPAELSDCGAFGVTFGVSFESSFE